MLHQFLFLLAENNLQTPRSLAARLGVSEGLIDQMAGQLVRQGYLELVDTCGSGCSDCSLRSGCHTSAPARLWALTEKGRLAARA